MPLRVPPHAGPLGPEPVEIRGAIAIDRTARGWLPRRLGAEARSQLPDDLMRQAVAESAGVRLAFRTAATSIELDVQATRLTEDEVSPVPGSWYDLTVDGELVAQCEAVAGTRYVVTPGNAVARAVPGPPTLVRFDGLSDISKEIEIWLPFTDEIELLRIRADAPLMPPSATRGPRWLHHGSSISHGYFADHVTGTWPVIAARASGADLTSLAFSGNAMLDQLTARTIRDTPADVISLKVGINIVNGDAMRLRAFRTAVHGFLDTIRDGHPDVPLLVVSPIFCEPVERRAGPAIQDPSKRYRCSIASGTEEDVAQGKLSLQAVRRELAATVAARQHTDDRLSYLDGLELYGASDAALMPLPDNVHPGPDVHRLIGERFARLGLQPLLASRRDALRFDS